MVQEGKQNVKSLGFCSLYTHFLSLVLYITGTIYCGAKHLLHLCARERHHPRAAKSLQPARRCVAYTLSPSQGDAGYHCRPCGTIASIPSELACTAVPSHLLQGTMQSIPKPTYHTYHNTKDIQAVINIVPEREDSNSSHQNVLQ